MSTTAPPSHGNPISQEIVEIRRRKRLKSATGVPYPTGYLVFRGIIFHLSRLRFKYVLLNAERIPHPGGVKYRPKWYRRNGSAKIDQGAFIIASNHGSILDVSFIGMFRRGLVWICKPFFCLNPWAAKVNQRMGAVPIFRPGLDDDRSKNSPERIAYIRAACYTADEGLLVGEMALERGVPAIVFPEGTRMGDAEIGDAKEGAARLARRSGCPILPLAIAGCAKGDPVARTRILRRRILVGAVGELMYPEDFSRYGSLKQCDQAMMAAWLNQANALRLTALEQLRSYQKFKIKFKD